MLKKSARGVLEIREAYLVKRRSIPDSDVSRFTNDENGLFEHPEAIRSSIPYRIFQLCDPHEPSFSATC
jgi:hypothetical protein